MESFNKQIKDDIGGIQELLVDSAQIPVISTVEGNFLEKLNECALGVQQVSTSGYKVADGG
jgi:hypothetical protein